MSWLNHYAVGSDMVMQVPVSDLLYSFCPMEWNWVYFIWYKVVLGGYAHLGVLH